MSIPAQVEQTGETFNNGLEADVDMDCAKRVVSAEFAVKGILPFKNEMAETHPQIITHHVKGWNEREATRRVIRMIGEPE